MRRGVRLLPDLEKILHAEGRAVASEKGQDFRLQKRKGKVKVLHLYNLMVLPHLYQTKLFFRSHDQMGHQ